MKQRQLAILRLTIWINGVLWMMAFAAVMAPWPPEYANYPKYVAGAGVLLSACIQHWAYYNLHKWYEAESTLMNTTNQGVPHQKSS